MPNRLLRDWTNSDKVDTLSFQAEVFLTRLIMNADDFGCFWADSKRLKANLFPLKSDSIRETDISRWMAECQKAGLIVVYDSDRKRYLQIIDFNQRLRAKRSKYPLPPAVIVSQAHARHMTDTSLLEQEVEVEEKENAQPPDFDQRSVTFNTEDTILANQVRLEQICMSTGKSLEQAKASLHKYHLYMEEKELYPKSKKAVFAGFEKWLLNENKFSNSPSETGSTKTQMVM